MQEDGERTTLKIQTENHIEEIQTEFAKGIGSIDIGNLTDDFVEDVMLQSKPLQGILMAIRIRQKVQCVSSSPAKKSAVPDLASHASRYIRYALCVKITV